MFISDPNCICHLLRRQFGCLRLWEWASPLIRLSGSVPNCLPGDAGRARTVLALPAPPPTPTVISKMAPFNLAHGQFSPSLTDAPKPNLGLVVLADVCEWGNVGFRLLWWRTCLFVKHNKNPMSFSMPAFFTSQGSWWMSSRTTSTFSSCVAPWSWPVASSSLSWTSTTTTSCVQRKQQQSASWTGKTRRTRIRRQNGTARMWQNQLSPTLKRPQEISNVGTNCLV